MHTEEPWRRLLNTAVRLGLLSVGATAIAMPRLDPNGLRFRSVSHEGKPDEPRGKVYFHTPGTGSVTWDPDLKAVVETWEGWANATEFAALLDAGVRALAENHGSRWLADCRRQRVLKAADQTRGNQEWLPRALAVGLKRFAVVLPESGLAKFNLQLHLGGATAKQMEVAYFATADEARRWVAQTPVKAKSDQPP
jgi:hypothetical protein